MAFGVSMCVLNLLISFAMTYLVTYHIWLKYKGLTTYQHILLKREKFMKMRDTYMETADNDNEI